VQAYEPDLDPADILAGEKIEPIFAAAAAAQVQSQYAVTLMALNIPGLYFCNAAVGYCTASRQKATGAE
jgi:hypothetical protein